MRFINPKNDYAFKRIFGSDQSKEILISFLNAILYQEKEVIKDLEIINPYALGANFTLKDTYLDVKAKLENNTTVLIEMQLLNRYAFDKRVIYNAAKVYANQLDSGEKYHLLQPVIALTIIDFIMFENSQNIVNSFVFKEETKNFTYNEEIKLVFVELPKFTKQINELASLIDKWLFFLKNAPELKEKPHSLEIIPALNRALEIANIAALSVEELEEIQKRAMFLTDQEGISFYAKELGRQEGRQEGLEMGVKMGVEQEARKIVIRQIKRRLGEILPTLENQINQLSTQEIELLGEELLDFHNETDLINWLQQLRS